MDIKDKIRKSLSSPKKIRKSLSSPKEIRKSLSSPKEIKSDLIYTVAVGSQYIEMCKLLIESIRKSGFNGEILALTDQPISFSKFQITTQKPKLSKTMLHEMINIDNFNDILFLDADIIITGDIKRIFSCSNSFVNSDYTTIKTTYMHYACLTPYELKKFGNNIGINSGTIFLHNKTKLEILKSWNKIMKKCGSPSDQAALDALNIRSNYLSTKNIVEFVGGGKLKKLANKNANPIMKHWAGVNPKRSLPEMKAILS